MKNETCCVCGVEFGLSDELYRARLTDGGLFSCPNGHQQHYTAPRDKGKQIRRLIQDVEHWQAAYRRVLGELDDAKELLTLARLRTAGYKSQWLRLKRKQRNA